MTNTNNSGEKNAPPLRITLVGAESCGKTTLAKQLAGHYKSWWIPEYWRYYWEAKHLASQSILTSDEFIHIAKMQILIERQYCGKAQHFIFLDTDTFMTSIWHYRYHKKDSEILEKIWRRSRRDLILFCTAEIPFVQDGTRDGELIRDDMSTWIENKLQKANLNYVKISGSVGDRFTCAQSALDELFKSSRH
jgi:HTH-type transcriptional repressor of NAD biosynthesis genes